MGARLDASPGRRPKTTEVRSWHIASLPDCRLSPREGAFARWERVWEGLARSRSWSRDLGRAPGMNAILRKSAKHAGFSDAVANARDLALARWEDLEQESATTREYYRGPTAPLRDGDDESSVQRQLCLGSGQICQW